MATDLVFNCMWPRSKKVQKSVRHAEFLFYRVVGEWFFYRFVQVEIPQDLLYGDGSCRINLV